MREIVRMMVEDIKPYDSVESEHKKNSLNWIDGDEEIFRLEKPATPPKHLVSYFVLVDLKKGKLMLVDHIKAELWLPSGGHVEKDEHPKVTVQREIKEELMIDADLVFEEPIFLTETVTVGKTAGHTDVSLWYVVKANSEQTLEYDAKEFNGYKWFSYQEILNMPISELDPHMHRFTKKLIEILGSNLKETQE